MDDKISAARARAEAGFKKPDGSEAGPILTTQDTELRAVQEKTARLKAMRLAKEEVEQTKAASVKSTTKPDGRLGP